MDSPTRLFRSAPARALLGLVLGFLVGIAIGPSQSAGARWLVSALDPIGTIWVNGIRMTVIPLVVSLLISTIASADDLSALGKMGTRLIIIFLILLTGVALLGLLAVPPVIAQVQIDPASAANLRASAHAAAVTVPPTSFTTWLVGLIPSNPIKAATDGAMLPLIIFSVVFAVALARVTPDLRVAAATFFRALAAAMLVLVGWVLALAPIGVFALTATLAARVGSGIAGAVALYLALHCGLLVVTLFLLYVVIAAAGVPLGRFARAVLPAQIVAMSTRSSVAALPAMIDGAERVLQLPVQVTSFALPFGVSVFRLNQGVSWMASALFIATLYGVHLGAPEMLLLAAASVGMSFSVPGIPSGGLFIVAPFFMSVGLPLEGIGILIALDVIPDVFKTTVNVTGHMTATVLLARQAQPAVIPQARSA